jgi:hypothetical protein
MYDQESHDPRRPRLDGYYAQPGSPEWIRRQPREELARRKLGLDRPAQWLRFIDGAGSMVLVVLALVPMTSAYRWGIVAGTIFWWSRSVPDIVFGAKRFTKLGYAVILAGLAFLAVVISWPIAVYVSSLYSVAQSET